MPAIVINKVPYDFHNTSLDIMVNGESVANIEGVTAIEYTPSVERVKLRGRGRKPLAMTDGELDAEASITVYRYAFDQIVEVARPSELGSAIWSSRWLPPTRTRTLWSGPTRSAAVSLPASSRATAPARTRWW